VPLREFLLASGQPTQCPDRDAEYHDPKDDLDDQEEEPCRDPNEGEEGKQQDFPQQDGDYTRGGYAENGLQNNQAPVEARTLRQFIVKSVSSRLDPDRQVNLPDFRALHHHEPEYTWCRRTILDVHRLPRPGN
jgi:hypothetical protein